MIGEESSNLFVTHDVWLVAPQPTPSPRCRHLCVVALLLQRMLLAGQRSVQATVVPIEWWWRSPIACSP